MKRLVQISLILWFVSSAAAQAQPASPWPKTLRVFDWKDVKLQPEPPDSEIFSTNGVSVLKIENTNSAPLEVSLLMITNSALIAKAATILLEMKYENVGRSITFMGQEHTNASGGEGRRGGRFPTILPSELTLLARIAPEVSGGDESTNKQGFYFDGTSNWKPYWFSTDVRFFNGLPTRLELKLSMPTNGTVYLRPVKLLVPVDSSDSWWSPQQGGLIGGIGGSLMGCFGGLIGLLVSKGRARNFVLASVKCFIVLGILLTAVGVAAAVLKQPYAVWYALLLPGVILILVFSLNLHSIQRRYD